MKTRPFFIFGCVRSGTTMLRDVLRRHPNLAAPEETQFFRWAEPFGSDGLYKILSNNPVLQKHRELDGITEKEYQALLKLSVSRADLYRRYMGLYLQKNKPTANRWFDKSPQNVYGAAMMAMEFPGSKFVHIVRNPFDVVSSLRIGKIVKMQNLIGACNYWNEAAEIVQVIKKAYPRRLYEVKYEDFTREPHSEIEKMLGFLEEDFSAGHFVDLTIKAKQHEVSELFGPEEIEKISQLCRRWGAHYGYMKAAAKAGRG